MFTKDHGFMVNGQQISLMVIMITKDRLLIDLAH